VPRPIAIALLTATACSSTTSTPIFQSTPLPPLNVTITTDPPPGPDGAYRDAKVRLGFDDYPDPDTAGFGPLVLRSGKGAFDVEITVDLVGKAIVVRPRSLLDPGIQYELLVSSKVGALDGRTVGGGGATAQIPVGMGLSPSPSPSPAPVVWKKSVSCTPGDPDYVPNNVACFMVGCAPYCHTTARCPGRDGTRQPSRQLDLSLVPTDPDYSTRGLVGVPSVGLVNTADPLMRVLPYDAARSVLLRKLIGGDPHADSMDPPAPDLRVDGRRMPLQENPCDPTLPLPTWTCADGQTTTFLCPEQIKLVQDWIDQGARY
jgi:hypothetical protein